MDDNLRSPYTWFGGKAAVADTIWTRFGDTRYYVDAFAGSLAITLARPTWHKGRGTCMEYVIDMDGHIVNFWRSVAADPNEVAEHALRIRGDRELHAAITACGEANDGLGAAVSGDLEFYDARLAGVWVYAQCLSIGNGLARGNSGARQVSYPGGVTTDTNRARLPEYLTTLSQRVSSCRIMAIDALRFLRGADLRAAGQSTVAVALDPPYSHALRPEVYGKNDHDVSGEVHAWAMENGTRENYRIALCGYAPEHADLEAAGWSRFSWESQGGMGNTAGGKNENARRETIWFSPHCLGSEGMLF